MGNATQSARLRYLKKFQVINAVSTKPNVFLNKLASTSEKNISLVRNGSQKTCAINASVQKFQTIKATTNQCAKLNAAVIALQDVSVFHKPTLAAVLAFQ